MQTSSVGMECYMADVSAFYSPREPPKIFLRVQKVYFLQDLVMFINTSLWLRSNLLAINTLYAVINIVINFIYDQSGY